jgi:hypothetical protein
MPSHSFVDEPDLLFHPDRPQDRHAHPLRGLLEHGPFSRSLVNTVFDPIRIASIYPSGFRERTRAFFREFEQQHRPRERKAYLVDYPGFNRIFGLRLNSSVPEAHIELPASLDDEIATSKQPHLRLAEALTAAMNRLNAFRNEFDVLMIYLPDRWSVAFFGQTDDFNLHDYIKAVNASRGVPTQIVLENSALQYFCRASVMWRLGIALYCKAGGVPWKLADQDPETAYIGLSYAVRAVTDERPRFVTCCSQVFDSDGAGLQFLAYETDDAHIERDNPFLSRAEMRRVMARSLALYQRRHAGRSPKRVVVHKSTEFKPEETSGCFDALHAAELVELYQIQQDTLWRGVQINSPKVAGQKTGDPSMYPCARGTYLPLGTRELLLWTQGNAPKATGGRDFYKEGKGVPQPIVLKRFAGHGDWSEPTRGVLGLSKMNWNNDSLYDRLPVTLSYASILARTIKRMPTIQARPYEFRFFM